MWIQTATPIQFPLGTDAVDKLGVIVMIAGIKSISLKTSSANTRDSKAIKGQPIGPFQ